MVARVFALLQEKPLSKLEIAIALGKKKPTRYINDVMAQLIRDKKLEFTNPAKPNSRLQKYQLPTIGKKTQANRTPPKSRK